MHLVDITLINSFMQKMDFCRACLTTKESFSYVLCENVSADVYYYCTALKVYESEALPRTLCNSCYELVEKFFKFKQTCIQSQHTLEELLNSLKSDKDGNAADALFNEDVVTEDHAKSNVKIESENDCNDDFLAAEDYLESIKATETHISKIKKSQSEVKINEYKKDKVRKHFKYKCTVCNTMFKYEDRFEAHLQFHQGITATINCTHCRKTFTTWSGLQRHIDSEHTQVKLCTLTCLKCGKLLKNRQTLKLHEKFHIDKDKEYYVCDVCGKNFTTPFSLKGHMEIHNEHRERPFACTHCGKKFYTNGILMTHVARLHSGKRYICHICSFPFTDKYNLSKHLLIHQGIKNYKCNICEKTFRTQSSLVIHKRIHSGDRPFICSYCPKAFISKNRLVDHHRVHTGDRPFSCTLCSQAFTQNGSLRRHMKIHSKAASMPI